MIIDLSIQRLRGSTLILILVSLAHIIALFVPSAGWLSFEERLILLITNYLFVFIFLQVVLRGHNSNNIFSPRVFFCIGIILSYALPALLVVSVPDLFWDEPLSLLQESEIFSGLLKMNGLLILAGIATLLGYKRYPLNRMQQDDLLLRVRNTPLQRGSLLFFGGLFVLLGLLGIYLLYGSFGGLINSLVFLQQRGSYIISGQGRFIILMNLFPHGLVLLAFAAGMNKAGIFWKARTACLLGVAALLSLPVLIVFGGRSNLLLFVLSCLGTYNYCVRKLSGVYIWILGALLVVLSIFIGEVRTYSTQKLYEFDFYQSINVVKKSSLADHIIKIASEFNRYTIGTVLVQRTEGMEDLVLGETIMAGIQNMVPERFVGRRLRSSGQVLSERMYGERILHSDLVGHERMMGLIGELYANFWMVGVFIGFVIVGRLLKRLDQVYDSLRGNVFYSYLMANILFFIMTIPAGNLSTLPSILIYQISPLAVAFVISNIISRNNSSNKILMRKKVGKLKSY